MRRSRRSSAAACTAVCAPMPACFIPRHRIPTRTPIYKLEPLRKVWQQEYTFWGRSMKALGLSKPVTDEELAEWEDTGL